MSVHDVYIKTNHIVANAHGNHRSADIGCCLLCRYKVEIFQN